MNKENFVDHLGNELQVGDVVVFPSPGYHSISVAKIHHFSTCQVVLDVVRRYGKLVPFSEKKHNERGVSRYPKDVIKLPKEYLEDKQ